MELNIQTDISDFLMHGFSEIGKAKVAMCKANHRHLEVAIDNAKGICHIVKAVSKSSS
jgi:hypothetical protein